MNDAEPEPPEFDDETIREENVKHLEFLQAIVTRLGGNSMLLKGWSLTVAAAAYGFSVNRVDWRLTLIGILSVIGFWFLDAYFLRQERLFRLLYDHARSDIRAVPRFSMSYARYVDRDVVSYRNVILSLTLSVYYGMLFSVGVIVAVLAFIFRP